MKLVIVESPAKSKTISKYLGSGYKILSSFGHIRDLPSKDGSVDPEKNFAMHYEVKDTSKKHVKAILDAAKDAEEVYIASDPDREGEAIAWHLQEVMREKKIKAKIKRATFTEITPVAVKNGIKNCRDIDTSLVNAQQARLSLDYLVGFHLSPVLWRKLPSSKSAGRVQSVALRLIVERENEIRAFISSEYWSIDFNVKSSDESLISVKTVEYNKKKISQKFPNNEEDANDIVNFIEDEKKFIVADISSKDAKRRPVAPFNTASLQQDASNKLGFSTDRTMKIAQKLYEGVEINGNTSGLITYMRTDGTTIGKDALQDIRDYIKNDIGEKYLPKSPNIYKTKTKNAQEAHEAIRPTNINLTPNEIGKFLDKDELKLYELIWKRTIACQMEDAIFLRQSIDFVDKNKKILLRANGNTIKFDGFLKLYEIKDDGDENATLLPKLEIGDVVAAQLPIKPKQHFTSPKSRYTEASLVKEMEELGIGRPSTYATIIRILQEREYVHIEKRQFHPDARGILVTTFLKAFFSKYVEYDFTAKLESDLDIISDGKMEKLDFLNNFWKDFHKQVDESIKTENDIIGAEIAKILQEYIFCGNNASNKKCKSCGSENINIKTGKYGAYLSCEDCGANANIDKYLNSQNINSDNMEKSTHIYEGQIGTDELGNIISKKTGKFGDYIEQSSGKDIIKRASIPNFVTEINIDIAMFLLALPKKIGTIDNLDCIVGIGKYGPYILHNGSYTSIPQEYNIFTLSAEEAKNILINKPQKSAKSSSTYQKKTIEIGEHPKGGKILIGKSKYGIYALYKKKFYTIQDATDTENVTLEIAIEAINSSK